MNNGILTIMPRKYADELDDFDKMLYIEMWFKMFTKKQRENMLKIINRKTEHSEGSP